MIHSGNILVDKYLGDALYAIMIYLILCLLWIAATPLRRSVVVMFVMTVLETFQLTSIPLELSKNENISMRTVGRLLGTTFSWLDLAAYFVGIAAVLLVDYCWFNLIREDTR